MISTPAALPLRDYQQDTIGKVIRAIGVEGIQRPAVVIPTGGGKTVIFAHMATRGMLILVHRDELATQAANKVRAACPHLSVGIVKAEQNDVHVDVIVGSVQTLRNPARLAMLPKINLVIVDEAHHAAADSYVSIMTALGCYAPNGTPAVGFSATLVRGDKRSLGKVWDKVVQQIDILDMIPEWLVDPRGIKVVIDGLSLADVKRSGGDFTNVSLSDFMLSADAQKVVADAYVEHAADRQGILFAPSKAAARAFADELNARGIKAAAIWDGMAKNDRRDTLKRFERGEVQVLCNCMILTEGYDAPWASCVVIARPTTSAALYVQMVGRGLRKSPGKVDALILDVVGASEEHDLATLADLSSRRVDKVEPGESLTGAAKRLKKAGHPALAGYVSHADVDLFKAAVSMWLRTEAGLYFIALPKTDDAPESLVFLWPTDTADVFHVGVCPQSGKGGSWIKKDVSLDDAMAWAEEAVKSVDAKSLTNRRAAWRKRKEAPSPAQVRFAQQLKIEVTPETSKPELSDLITIKLASRRLDPTLPKVSA